MPQFFCFRDSEVQCQNIDYGFAATGHHTCHTPGVGIRVCEFQNVLNDDKGTASGNCTHDDLNLIIRDIREFHKKDSESAPQTTVADELKENLEAVENFKGSRDEKLVILYCKQLGINYKNLSEEEFRWFIRILKKSKKMGTPISQRKKR